MFFAVTVFWNMHLLALNIHCNVAMQPYHDIELKISQGSEGPDVRLEFY